MTVKLRNIFMFLAKKTRLKPFSRRSFGSLVSLSPADYLPIRDTVLPCITLQKKATDTKVMITLFHEKESLILEWQSLLARKSGKEAVELNAINSVRT